jgi:tetratricopeptide (TPR) repeat protein
VIAQTEHLHEQRSILLSHLKLRRFIDRMKAVTQVFIASVVALVALTFFVMIYDAHASRSVVVEPFSAPSALAESGLSGTGMAAGLLDQLTRLQSASRDVVAKRNLSGAWTEEIKIELPETGVSIGELERLLKYLFGHDIRITGELRQTAAGRLTLTVRGDGVLPKTFPDKADEIQTPGKADEIETLTLEAAEYIYGQAEPSLYATYLITQNRNVDAVRFSQGSYRGAVASERPFLLNEWANAIENISDQEWTTQLKGTGDKTQTALSLYEKALALKPDYWRANDNVQATYCMLGKEEMAWAQGDAMRKAAGGRHGRAPDIAYNIWDQLTWNLQDWREALVADVESHSGIGSELSAETPVIAAIDLRLHDTKEAELELTGLENDPGNPTVSAMSHFAKGQRAAQMNEKETALTEMEAFGLSFANPAVSSNYPGYDCWIAPVEEAAGHRDRADAVLNAAGAFVDCYRFRGDILNGRGDWSGAQKAYANAVALAVDLPAAYYSWGIALARRGDLEGAKVKFEAANKRGPHWADPLKAWGDVLVREGHPNDALAKFDEALKYAPKWETLQKCRKMAIDHVPCPM